MKRAKLRNFLLVTVLIIATGVAMAYSSGTLGVFTSSPPPATVTRHTGDAGVLTVSGHLIQDKVLEGSEGNVGLNITLQAEEIAPMEGGDHRNVDMVIVLDRSGSMKGRKIDDARRAVLELLSNLTNRDRFALVTYSDGVHIASELRNVTDDNRLHMASAVNSVLAGGGTNLGSVDVRPRDPGDQRTQYGRQDAGPENNRAAGGDGPFGPAGTGGGRPDSDPGSGSGRYWRSPVHRSEAQYLFGPHPEITEHH